MNLRFALSLLLIGFSLNSSTAVCQGTVVVEGRVLDSISGEPLVGAAVFLESPAGRVGAMSRKDGTFRIEKVSPGVATLHVRLIGYIASERSIDVLPGTPNEFEIRLTAGTVTLRPLEVIGESPEVHRSLPGTATRIDTRELEAIAPIGTQEVIQRIPGINAAADDGIGNSRISVGIRGLSPRRSSRVLVLEDGVPIAPALYLYPNMYYNPPAERIDAVEVIKGSAAIRYGPQTMGGVINYLTRRPRTELGGLAQLTVGTNGYVAALAELGGWGSRAMQPEIQLLYKRGDGFRDHNAFSQYNATAKLTVTPDEDRVLYIKANADVERSEATYTGLTEYSFAHHPTFNPKENDQFDVVRASLDILYSHELSRSASSMTKFYANYFDREWWRENDIFVRPGGAAVGERQAVPYFESGDLLRVGNGRDNYGNLRRFYVLGIEHSYTLDHALFSVPSRTEAGGRFHWDRFLDNRVIGDAPDARAGVYYREDPLDSTNLQILGLSNHYETTAFSFFASNRLTFGPLTVTPGVRVELFEQELVDRLRGSLYQDRSSYVLLPGIGINIALADWNVFGGLHRGYTPPSSGALAVVNWGSEVENGGLDVRSETSWNAELGVRAAVDGARFELAAFHMSIDDLVAAGIGSNFKDYARARTFGAELGAHVSASEFHDVLPDLDVAYTLLRTEVVEGTMRSAVIAGKVPVGIGGKELPYAPRHALSVGVSRDLPFGLSAHADLQYVGRVYTDFENIEKTYNRGDTGPVPAYWLINVSASYRITPELTISLAGKNLLDRVYIGSRLHSNPALPEANQSSGILPGARRQINLTARYAFGG